MLRKISLIFNPFTVPAAVLAKTEEKNVQREITLQVMLELWSLLFILTAVPAILLLPNPIWGDAAIVYLVTGIIILSITPVRSLPFMLRVVLLILPLQILAGAVAQSPEIYALGFWVALVMIFTSALLFNAYMSFANTLLGTALLGFYTASAHPGLQTTLLIAAFFTASSIAILIVETVKYNERRMIREKAGLKEALAAERDASTTRAQLSASEAARRLSLYEVVTQVARDAAFETDLETLMNNVVNLVRDRFGYYHAGIFLKDERGEYAELRAATGEAGRQMLERSHRLRVGAVGLVGYASDAGETRVAADVTTDKLYYKNSLLPDTRGEIAVPLRTSGRVIGALDVQSTEPDAFTADDIYMLQTVANQLATAVENVQLAQKAEAANKQTEERVAQTTQHVWQRHLRNARRRMAYRFRDEQLQALDDTAEITPPITTGSLTQHESSGCTLAVPIRVRGQVLGTVDLHFGAPQISSDLVNLIENTVDRLAVSLENARLLEDIQQRAERERLVSEITSKVRASSEIEKILQVTAQELGRSLGVNEVAVQLRPAARAMEG